MKRNESEHHTMSMCVKIYTLIAQQGRRSGRTPAPSMKSHEVHVSVNMTLKQ